MVTGLPRKDEILTEAELDDAVYRLVQHAHDRGLIPIAGIISRRLADGRHQVIGSGWNRLREGVPGIHGETGAVINAGRLEQGHGDVVATSSLSPCEFCQRTLACHLGVRTIRILDNVNLESGNAGYAEAGILPTAADHPGIIKLFNAWQHHEDNRIVWARDIGLTTPEVIVSTQPVDVSKPSAYLDRAVRLAGDLAQQGLDKGEAPIGAVVLDCFGEVIGCGHPRIRLNNDPSMVAAMSAWRACGARDHWRDKTLVLTTGPDHIAYSMFSVFNFGQLVVLSDRAFAGQLDAMTRKNLRVTQLDDHACDNLLRAWVSDNQSLASEYLGVGYMLA